MERLKNLKSQLSETLYKDLESFWINHTNFTEPQAERFISLLEKINKDSKEVKLKNLALEKQ
jgi:hypothetical protein